MGDILATGAGAVKGGFNTAVQRIAFDLRKTRDNEIDAIKRALISAMEHYKYRRFWFNEGSWTMTTTADTSEYGLETTRGNGDGIPKELLQVDNIFIFRNAVSSSDPNNVGTSYELQQRHVDTIRYWIDSTTDTRRPYYYAYHHNKFLLYPTPDDVYKIRIDGMKNLDIPQYQYSSGSWIYSDQDGAVISDSYSSDWLVYADELIRSRAVYSLWANTFDDMNKAAAARDMERQAYEDLVKGTYKRKATGRVRPNLAGSSFYG